MAGTHTTLILISALSQVTLPSDGNRTIEIPGSLTIQQGLCVVIPCQFTQPEELNTTRVKVTWNKLSQNPTVTQQDSVYQEYESSPQWTGAQSHIDCSLQISPITEQDTGLYQVTIGSSRNFTSSQLNLTITGRVLRPTILSEGEIVQGNVSTLRCTIRAECSVSGLNLTWLNLTSLNLSEPVGVSRWDNVTSLITTSLSFRASADENGKQIGCLMEYPSEGLNSLQTLSLDVKYGPRVDKLQPVMVKEQDSVQMVCTVSSNPLSTITWYRGRERLASALGDALTLNISNITSRDQGDYTCRAHNRIGRATRTVPITVQYPPRIHWMGGSIGVLDGELFRQDCVVDSYPVSNTSWRRAGRILNESVSNTLTLIIPAMGKGDFDLYTCSSVNPFGNASQSLHIRLEYAPRNISITLGDQETLNASIEASEGESVSLLCSVDSEPMANLSWTLDGEIRNATSWNAQLWLTIPNVTYQDHGLHTCTAHNPHGASQRSVSINVNYSPKEVSVLVPAGDAGIREGCDVTLRCQSESHPPPRNYSWIRMFPGHPPRLIAVTETMTLRSVSRRESAAFFCRVSNDLGIGESAPFHLNVEYGPEISWESKCAEGAAGITCVCAANSNPPAVITWHLPHANLSGNQTHGGFVSEQLREGHLVKGFLILTGHQDEEEVVVSCSVRNPHGASSFKVYLWVKEERHLVNLVLSVMVGALAMLIMMLLLCLISLFCQRKRKEHVFEATEMEELTVQPQPARPASREMEDEVEEMEDEVEDEAECGCEGGSEVNAVRLTENGEHPPVSDDVELHYACIDFTKSQSSHGIVGDRDSTQYAEIKLQ